MNKVIRQETVAAELPEKFRSGIDPENTIRIVVEDLGRRSGPGERILALAGAAKHKNTSIAEAVARVRELRDDE